MFLLYYLHADETDSSKLGGHNVRKSADLGFLSSSQVQAATSVAGLKAVVDAAVCHADEEGEKDVVDEGLDMGANLGELTDTTVQAATSVEGLVDLTQATGDGRRGPGVKE